ncbi:MAG: 6-phosphofructokinase, partial [Acidobacteriota bacterium]
SVNDMLKDRGRVIVVVSEGFDVGDIGELKDSFGHTTFSSSEMTVAQIVVNHLNQIGLPCRGSARGNVPGTDQRHSIIHASTVDLDEAYEVARHAVVIAAENDSGHMATILREPGPGYRVRYDKVPLDLVANSERFFPAEWLTPSRTDVTDDFLKYALPLIGEDWPEVTLEGGLQRFARLRPVYAETRLAEYVPEAHRG